MRDDHGMRGGDGLFEVEPVGKKRPTRPGQPTEQEIRAVQQAWAAASTNNAA
jgi:hypothetical protein